MHGKSLCAGSVPPPHFQIRSGATDYRSTWKIMFMPLRLRVISAWICRWLSIELVFNLHRSDHVSNALISLHWLRVSERIRSKVAVLVCEVLHGCRSWIVVPWPVHLRCRLPKSPRASLFLQRCLVQPPVHRFTVGSRLLYGPHVWNCLPPEFTSAPSLTAFTRLKTFLFTESKPESWHSAYFTFLCVHSAWTSWT